MSLERSQRLLKALELLEPHLSTRQLVSIRDRCSHLSMLEHSDAAHAVIAHATALFVERREKQAP